MDDEDFESLSRHKWQAVKDHNGFYAAGSIKNDAGVWKCIRMHRHILGLFDPKICVDHKNGNTLDNTKNNLRACSPSENARNRKTVKHSTSGYKGVYWNKPTRKWFAHIKFNYKDLHIGSFDCKIEAAKAYDQKAKELHGDFARLNFE